MYSIILGIITSVLGYYIYAIYKFYVDLHRIHKCIERVPGPKALPIIGNALEFSSGTDVLPALMRLQNKHGLNIKLLMGPVATFIFTSDYNFIEFILTSNKTLNKSRDYKFIGSWLGLGLITGGGERYQKHKKVISPAFHYKRLEEFIEVFDKNCNILIDILNKTNGEANNVYENILLCTLDTICESVMGISINAQTGSTSDKYVESVKWMGRLQYERTFIAWKQFDCLYALSKDYHTELNHVKLLHEVTNRVIKARKAELKTKQNNKNKKYILLDTLLNSAFDGENGLSDEEIREEVDTLMFAGHDTIASSMGFILHNLANHPDVQNRLYEEIMKIAKGNDTITLDMLSEMKYCEMVIKESLRMYPSVPVFARSIDEDMEYNGIILPKGLRVAIFAYGAHRNTEIYPNPEVFDPERFNPSITRPTHSYIAFSGGQRNCIGQKYAMLEMKTLIFKLIKQFKLLPVPEHKIILSAETVLKSSNGIYIKAQKRK